VTEPKKSGFARRPSDPEAWVRAAEKPAADPAAAYLLTAAGGLQPLA